MSQSGERVKFVVNSYKDHHGAVTNVNEARDVINNSTYCNVLPTTSELRPIIFRYRPPTADFIGRKKQLDILKENLCIENPRIMVVSGLGGIGKTQLVKKFIEENKKFYRNIVWINSQRKESIEEELKKLAESDLEISLNVNGKPKDFRCILEMIFDKLSTGKTFLVFDNVDDVGSLEILPDIVAVAEKPHILITSRIRDISDEMNSIKLEVLSSNEALDYISTKLSDANDTESLEDRMALADTLKNLPLALRQATGHIKHHKKLDKNYKIRSYIDEYSKYREKILRSDLFQKDILNQYKETIFTTWKVTTDAIKVTQQHGDLALRILNIMAYFDNVQIIREIFFNLDGNDPELNKDDVTSAVSLICNYSMVDDYDCQSVLTIHKLVQEVIQIQLENEQRSMTVLREGLQLISQMENNRNFKDCLPHGISVYLAALRYGTLIKDFDAYPSMILQNLDKSGNYLRAFSFANEIKEQFSMIFGMDHPSTTLLQFLIAKSYSLLGKYCEALQMYEEVLEKRSNNLGEDHPDTIGTRHNMAIVYINLGRYSTALELLEVVLEKRKIILDEDNPDTIATMSSIAYSYGKLGRYSEALKMHKELLGKRRAILGIDHPDTLGTMSSIAYSYGKLGGYSEALQLNEEVLKARSNTLGKDHPSTIASMSSIAYLYGKLSRYCEALQLHEQVLEKRNNILGIDHPDTIATMSSIAYSYSKLSRYCEALKMYKELLEKRSVILGVDHPDTIAAMSSIAYSYGKLRGHSEALQLHVQVLEKRKVILGVDHPDTITAMSSIAYSYGSLRRHSEALQLHEQVLEKRKVVLGQDHPDTIAAVSSIANSKSNLGRHSEALQLHEKVLKKRIIVLGEHHSSTIATKSGMAYACYKLDNYSEALRLYEEVLEKRGLILGQDHPDLIWVKSKISDLKKKLGTSSPKNSKSVREHCITFVYKLMKIETLRPILPVAQFCYFWSHVIATCFFLVFMVYVSWI